MPPILDRALPRMARNSRADLGFEGIFQILAQIPEVRLVQYRHKLSCSHEDRRSCHLLHVMILLRLGREDEARVHLNGLRDDVAANHLFQSHWDNAGAGRTPAEQLQEQAKVAHTVAEIYSLLVDEKLCKPPARDEAYRAAIQAFQAGNIQGPQLKSLLDEAMDRCGLQFVSTVARPNFGAPVSGQGELTQPRRSCPLPTDSASLPDNPQSLRSTGSPVSHISFMISETSSTLESDCPYSIEVSSPPTGNVEETSSTTLLSGNGCSTHPGDPSLQNSRGSCLLPDPKSTRSPQASFQYPMQCTPTPKTAAAAAAGHLPAPFQTPPPQKLNSAASAGGAPTPGANSSAPAQITSLGPLQSSSSSELASCSSSMLPPADERQFYTFVVLHAAEDKTVADRVKERLEALGVSNGATFSEDFLVPGHSQLSCFQNALDNSAFTLLLLTRNFKGRLLAYQRDTALMDSLTRFCKNNSVIPFVPEESSLKPEEMPLLLASLVPLYENSPIFAKRVKKTFTPKMVQQKKEKWVVMRQIQEREERQEREQEEWQMQQRLLALSLRSPAATPRVDVSRSQGPLGHATQVFPPSTMSLIQPGVDQGSSSQPLMFSVGASHTMPGPQLIIQNAQMIQIGDYNRMQVERTNTVVGTADETVGEGPVVERGTSPRD